VKGPWELARFTSVRVLTPIPYIATAAERRRNRRRAWMIAGLAALLAVVFLVGVHVFLRPVPELFDAVLRRAGIG
jgi:FMN phosphatase YigB (HAD superfamily)